MLPAAVLTGPHKNAGNCMKFLLGAAVMARNHCARKKGSGMRTAGYRVALLLVAVLASGSGLLTAGAASAQQHAVTATVTGAKIQKVGFRAMIQREAIMYNLAGSARNNPDGSVEVASARRQGPDRSNSRRYSHRQQEIFAEQYNHRGPSTMGSQSEDVHGLRLDIDQPEYHEPL